MTLKKRGLGRGLEALLADVPIKEEKDLGIRAVSVEAPDLPVAAPARDARSSPATDGIPSVHQGDPAMALLDDIRRERLTLLEEAEALKTLMDELERIARGDLLEE